MARNDRVFLIRRPNGTMSTVHAPTKRLALRKLLREERPKGGGTYRVKEREGGDEFDDFEITERR